LDHAGAGIQGGETYAVPVNISEDDAYRFWIQAPRAIFVAQDDDGYYLGTYFIKTNHPGPGNHVCNCGYIVSESARGRGLAGELCRHSLDVARERGYRAMQYNLVVAKKHRCHPGLGKARLPYCRDPPRRLPPPA